MRSVPLVLPFLLLVFSCSGLPKPEFSWYPTDNPEAGDTIQFINESRRADAYNWEFGDGGISNSREPDYVFRNAGIFDVSLEAVNDAGSNVVVNPVKIFEPTILAFQVYDSTGSRALDSALVRVYDNQADLDSLTSPLFKRTTDSTGWAEFRNLESIVYYVHVSKKESGEYWYFNGYTDALRQNKVNFYTVACTL
jgi:hypothetical protein